jgi:hypothetical protein
MVKWALLVFALTAIVFLNIKQEEQDLLEGEDGFEELEAKALREHKGDGAEDKGYYLFGSAANADRPNKNEKDVHETIRDQDEDAENSDTSVEEAEALACTVDDKENSESTSEPEDDPLPKPQSSGNNNTAGRKFTQERLLATCAAAQDLVSCLKNITMALRWRAKSS